MNKRLLKNHNNMQLNSSKVFDLNWSCNPNWVLETHLLPGVWLDLRELKLSIVGVHFANLLPGGGAKHLDDFHQLVHARVAREDGLPEKQLRQHTPRAPYVCSTTEVTSEFLVFLFVRNGLRTDLGGVVNSTKDELRSAVVAGAYVWDVGLSLDQVLGRTKVAQLQHPRLRV